MDSCQHCQDTGKPRVREWTPANNATLGYQNIKCQGADSCQQCHTRIPEHQVSGSGLLSTFSGYRQNRSQGVDSCPHCHMTPKHKDYAASHRMQEHQPESQPAHPRIPGHQESGSRPLSTHYPSIPDTKSPGANLCQHTILAYRTSRVLERTSVNTRSWDTGTPRVLERTSVNTRSWDTGTPRVRERTSVNTLS